MRLAAIVLGQRVVAEIAGEKDFLVLTDEIYSRIIYGATCPSIYSQPGMAERTLLVDGFSKSLQYHPIQSLMKSPER